MHVHTLHTFTGDRPQLHQLHRLEGDGGQVVKVMEIVAPVWEDLALALQFSGSCIDTIERDSLRKVLIKSFVGSFNISLAQQ